MHIATDCPLNVAAVDSGIAAGGFIEVLLL
jgi:hypothetical protein